MISVSLALSQTLAYPATACETTDTGLVRCSLLCLFTPQLSLVVLDCTYLHRDGQAELT